MDLHPRLTAERRAQLARRGAVLFDGGRHFAAHECWEAIWRSTQPEPRDLWQGLVQLAAAFHHLQARKRPDVALRVMKKAAVRLGRLTAADAAVAAVAPADLQRVLAQVAAWLRWLEAPQGPGPRPVRLGGGTFGRR